MFNPREMQGEMEDLDNAMEKASRIVSRWRFKMDPSDRREFPSTFKAVEGIEHNFLKISENMREISEEFGIGPFKK